MKSTLVTVLFLAAAASAVQAGDKKDKPAQIPADYMHFAHSWEAAKAEAKERNVPIQISFHKDG
ncbi:MAG: hypothetical protein FD180_1166 [Planctomycetota bacterium]|nr:MAG: hypothetical protein FD180_1166 [Planctomycetota bacterium]